VGRRGSAVRTLAVVPARGGSKGLPGKNARPFLGVSLLERAIRIAIETCDDLVVTTDDAELRAIAWDAGLRYSQVRHRPLDLGLDDTPMLPVVKDAIKGRPGDVIVLLQPTQPLRTAEQVQQAVDMLEASGADSVSTVVAVPAAYVPDRAFHVDLGRLWFATDRPAARRQDGRPAYVLDGTVYAFRRAALAGEGVSWHEIDARPLILPGDALSIDTLEDFERLEELAAQTGMQRKLPPGFLPRRAWGYP